MEQERSIEAALERGEPNAAVARAKKALHSADKGVGVITADDFLAGMQHATGRCDCISGTMCHSAVTSPSRTPACWALQRVCIGSMAYPDPTPAVLLATKTRTSAANRGQKALSELNGTPGKHCTSITAPISQNGTEKAKTSKKNFRGDLGRRSPPWANAAAAVSPLIPEPMTIGAPHGGCLRLNCVGAVRHGLASGTSNLTTSAITSSSCPTQMCPPCSKPMNLAPAMRLAVYCALA